MKLASKLAALVAAVTMVAGAQTQPQTQPKPKSQKEVDALKKVQADAQANNYDQEITDINAVLENFADTEYKDMLLNMAMEASQRKGDYGQTVAFGEQVIQANPNDISSRVTLAETIAQHTRENDLDKEQSLKKVDDYSNKALDLLKTASAPPPGIPAAQWPEYKKQLEGQAHDAQGMADDVRKKYPQSVDDYKAALDAWANPVIMLHMGKAYIDNKQYDEAIANDDKALAMPSASPQVKQAAQQQKDLATKLKGVK